MRNRTEEINVRVYKTEKNTIRRKAKKCGMNMSEYLRSLGTGAAVREAPRRELMLAYQKLTTLHDTVRYELAMRDFDEALHRDREPASARLSREGGCRWR